jgi:hypothetical protein
MNEADLVDVLKMIRNFIKYSTCLTSDETHYLKALVKRTLDKYHIIREKEKAER